MNSTTDVLVVDPNESPAEVANNRNPSETSALREITFQSPGPRDDDQGAQVDDDGQGDIISKKIKVIQSVVLYFGFFILGTGGAIVGPSLLDLQLTSGASSKEITYIFIARAVGGIIGATLSGLIIAKINQWLLLGGSMLVCGVTIIVMPWCQPVSSLMVVMAIGGILGGFFDAGGNVTLLGIWGMEHGPWMQALHCIFGLGTWFAPLLVKPFLAEDVLFPQTPDAKKDVLNSSNHETDNRNVTNPPAVVYQSPTGLSEFVDWNQTLTTTLSVPSADNLNNTDDLTDNISSRTYIAYAYLIVGILCSVVFGTMLAIYWTTTDRKVRSHKKKANKTGEKPRENVTDRSFRIKLVTLVFIFYLGYCILEMNYGNYLLIYAVKHLGWSKNAAASLTSGYYGAFTASRALGIVLVKYFRPQVLMSVDVIMTVVSLTPALFFAKAHIAVLWITTILFGISMATIFALGITWTEHYIEVTGLVGAVFMIAGAGGELVGPVVISLLFKSVGYQSFMYVMFSFSALNLFIFVCMQLLAWKHGERYVNEVSREEDTQMGQFSSLAQEHNCQSEMIRSHEGGDGSVSQLNAEETAPMVDVPPDIRDESIHTIQI